ncbi:MAG: MtrB/PioB family outer membrane beta-barrel protein [Candidatus Tectomicrobia bacterium]|uniref:MtrB/PioB family outer membrane beta-barrel protein n=1 Tax=Tectimicrobiota bacterium TaxID=2528274 RepID=A0A932FW67_UNCTE|nr:MtrB/PioB family outer membrane beta-barrel protein [Candidatus Tectomicrobia bacterium]
MRKMLAVVAGILGAMVAFHGSAWGQTRLWGYTLKGSLGVGPRVVDVDKNPRKYEEDYNLFSGLRLFDFSLRGEAEEGAGRLFDYFRLEGGSLGGDPYPSGSLRFGKRGLYDLKVSARRVEYRYANPDETRAFSSVLEGAAAPFCVGDPRAFDWNRDFGNVELVINPDGWPKLNLFYRRQEQIGESTTTRHLSRAHFSLFQPVDSITNDYGVGLSYSIGFVDLFFEQSLRFWNNEIDFFRNRPTAPGELGGNPNLPTALTVFNWQQSETTKNPLTRINLHAVPLDWLEMNASYILSQTRQDHSFVSRLVGTASTGAPVAGTLLGGGDGEREISLFDLGFSVKLLENLFFHNMYRRYDSESSGSTLPRADQAIINFLSLGQEGNVLTQVDDDIRSHTLRSFLEYLPFEGLSLRFGYRWQNRQARRVRDNPALRRTVLRNITTRDNNFIFGFDYRPFRGLSIMGEYENLAVDNPFTEISSSDEHRAKVRIRYQPLRNLGLNVDYNLIQRSNTGGTPNLGSTILAEQGVFNQHSSDIDQKDYAVGVWYQPIRGLTWNASYMRQDLDFNTEIEFFVDGVLRGGNAVFSEDNNIFQTGLSYDLTSFLTTSLNYRLVNAEGSFPLDTGDLALGLLYKFKLGGRGMGLDLQYRRVRLDEKGSRLVERLFPEKRPPFFRQDNEYEANLWTVLFRVNLD